MFSSLLLFFGIGVAALYMWRRVHFNFGLTSILIGLMLLIHGPAYWYYTRHWVLGSGLASTFSHLSEGKIFSGITAEQMEISARFARYMARMASDERILSHLDIALGLTFIGLCVGVELAGRFARTSSADYMEAARKWSTTPPRPMTPTGRYWLKLLFGATIVMLFIFVVKEDQLDKASMYFLTSSDEFAKIAMRRELGGAPYGFRLMLATVIPFLAFYLWTWWREEGGQSLRLLAACMLVLVMVAKFATMSKAPPAIFLLLLCVVEMMRRSLQPTRRGVLMLAGAATTLFFLMTLVADTNVSGAVQRLFFLFYRAFMIPNSTLLEYFSIFPDQLPHTHGYDIRFLARLMGEEPLQASYWRVAEAVRGAPGSSSCAMFMADAWAQFSWFGVVAVPLMLGFLVRWIDIYLVVMRGRSYATIAALGLGVYGILIALTVGFPTALLTGGLLMIVPLAFLLEWFGKRKTVKIWHLD